MSDTVDASDPHFPDLAAYALGAMEPEEAAAFERLLADCASCQEELPRLREATAVLEPAPPEMFLDGPPENAEFLVRGTLRRIAAAEEAAAREAAASPGAAAPAAGRPRRPWLVAAAAAVALLAVGGVIGRSTAPSTVAAIPGPTATSSPGPTPVPGTRTATALDAGTGARLTVKVVPAAGWVRVTAAASGITAGQQCHLEVVSRSGRVVEAGSWVVSETGARDGTTLDGAAIVPPDDVTAVRVRNQAGDVLVRAEV